MENRRLRLVGGTSAERELLEVLPRIRAFARSLCGRTGSNDHAEDLTQQTVMRALANIDSYMTGSDMGAWLFTILRNEFYSEYRKRRHEVEDVDGIHSAKLETHPGAQESHVHCLELQDAMRQLQPDHREALMLVSALGLSYEKAAERCGCPVGTMKSRVNRGRARLLVLLGPTDGGAGIGQRPTRPSKVPQTANDGRTHTTQRYGPGREGAGLEELDTIRE